MNFRLLSLASIVATCGALLPVRLRAADASPALVVVNAVDQFRGDYLARFGKHFAPGGLRLLMEQGANFTDCHYRHAVTKTSCGHAVILTGVHANVHGIITTTGRSARR